MKETIEQYVSIWNSNDILSLPEVFSHESKYWDAMQEGKAVELLSGSIAATHQAFPNVLFKIISLNAISKKQFFLEWLMIGTNTGDFFGNPPTGKNIEIKGIDAIMLESAKIKEVRSYYDSSLFSLQLELQ